MGKKNFLIKFVGILFISLLAAALWMRTHPRVSGRLAGDPDLYGRPLFSKEDREKFFEGLKAVENAEGKYGYINEVGELVIDYKFVEAYGFSEGLAVVLVGGGYGYIDKTGKLVFDRLFLRAGSFSEGLAAVEVESFKAGYINHNGEFAIEPKYSSVYDFHNGVATVIPEAGKVMYINKKGEEVPNPNPYKSRK